MHFEGQVVGGDEFLQLGAHVADRAAQVAFDAEEGVAGDAAGQRVAGAGAALVVGGPVAEVVVAELAGAEAAVPRGVDVGPVVPGDGPLAEGAVFAVTGGDAQAAVFGGDVVADLLVEAADQEARGGGGLAGVGIGGSREEGGAGVPQDADGAGHEVLGKGVRAGDQQAVVAEQGIAQLVAGGHQILQVAEEALHGGGRVVGQLAPDHEAPVGAGIAGEDLADAPGKAIAEGREGGDEAVDGVAVGVPVVLDERFGAVQVGADLRPVGDGFGQGAGLVGQRERAAGEAGGVVAAEQQHAQTVLAFTAEVVAVGAGAQVRVAVGAFQQQRYGLLVEHAGQAGQRGAEGIAGGDQFAGHQQGLAGGVVEGFVTGGGGVVAAPAGQHEGRCEADQVAVAGDADAWGDAQRGAVGGQVQAGEDADADEADPRQAVLLVEPGGDLVELGVGEDLVALENRVLAGEGRAETLKDLDRISHGPSPGCRNDRGRCRGRCCPVRRASWAIRRSSRTGCAGGTGSSWW